MSFNVGDLVTILSNGPAHRDTNGSNVGKSGVVVGVKRGCTCPGDHSSVDCITIELEDGSLHKVGDDNRSLKRIIGSADPELNNNHNQEKSMASARTLVDAKLSADDRFAQAEFIEDSNGILTDDGEDAFLQYLYTDEVRTKFIGAMRAAKKKIAVDKAAYQKSVSADDDK